MRGLRHSRSTFAVHDDQFSIAKPLKVIDRKS